MMVITTVSGNEIILELGGLEISVKGSYSPYDGGSVDWTVKTLHDTEMTVEGYEPIKANKVNILTRKEPK